jgi:outer membrane protein
MDIDTDVSVNGAHQDKANIDPVGLMVGVGYRF